MMDSFIYHLMYKYMGEFGDGSDWTLSKCLTHANRTFNYIKNNSSTEDAKITTCVNPLAQAWSFIKSGEQVSIDTRPALKLGKKSLIVIKNKGY